MKIINVLSDDPNQSMNISLDDGSKIVLDLTYKSNQRGWFMTITWRGVVYCRNRRIVTSPNNLRALRNIIPFGISVVTSDNHEPVNLDDFTTGRAKFYILNSDDVAYAEGVIAAYAG